MAIDIGNINSVLYKGLVEPNCCTSCPDCDIYGLINTELYLKWAEAIATSPIPRKCCVNIAAVGPITQYPEDVIEDGIYYRYTDCDNGFKECIDTLKDTIGETNFNALAQNAIIEFGRVSTQSGICILLEYLNNKGVTDPNEIYLFFDNLLSKSLVFHCDGNNVVIGDAGIYLEYIVSTTT